MFSARPRSCSSFVDAADARVHHLHHRVGESGAERLARGHVALDDLVRRLHREVRCVVGDDEEERIAVMTTHERQRVLGEDVGEVAAVAFDLGAVEVEGVVVVVAQPAREAGELVEAARVRVIARVEGAVVPLADETGAVPGGPKDVRDRGLRERDAVEPATVQRVDRTRPLRIAPGQKRRSRRRADRRAAIVLRQADAGACERIDAPESRISPR